MFTKFFVLLLLIVAFPKRGGIFLHKKYCKCNRSANRTRIYVQVGTNEVNLEICEELDVKRREKKGNSY